MIGRERWVQAVTEAQDCGHTFFDLLTAVDLEGSGFEVVVHLWDPLRRVGEILRTSCPREDATVPTLTHVFAGAAWHERATAELFGIGFVGHTTTPLLLSETFEGHPLRKDFVLAARVAKGWPGAKEPGESDADLAGPQRRRAQPPGGTPSWAPP